MDLHLESFAIAPLIDDVVKTIEPLAEKNGNAVAVDCAPDIGTMRADQMRIRQALLNLASNANKFTERGTVTIARAARHRGRPRVDHDCGGRHRHRHDAASRWAGCSRSSSRPTPRPRASTAAPASGSRSAGASAR